MRNVFTVAEFHDHLQWCAYDYFNFPTYIPMFDGFVSSSKTNSVRQLPEKKDISEKFQYYVFPFLHSKKIYNLKRILLFLTV